ncbi:type II secretion system protein GspI [Chitinimonas arctica]|uniref:Type II secretion system protein I n=1 Tax=Chitinimonas arctica TaxID=2594795 RepID=A0A516SIK3_9NEIS|nr:type II secretion system minor pseudopilin GspI [Chitinimonas arctica]QDQ27973.1 type II secretion system protein GspI [Chitinimonas arctica]
MKRQLGFTLIEVLIALAVIGIALAASVRATIVVSDGSMSLRRHLVGGWVAQNRINAYLASKDFPELGQHEGKTTQAGMEFFWREKVGALPNKSFRRVEVKVYPNEKSDHADAVLVGFIARIPP